jgi:hypothetical protein
MRQDPSGVISHHLLVCKYRWPYQNEVCLKEDIYWRDTSLDDLTMRIGSK